jgi:hypothetical protein
MNSGISLTPGHSGEDYLFVGDYADGQITITGPGEYHLSSDLNTSSQEYGIQIESPDVVLDGYGYSLFGSGNYSTGVNVLSSGKYSVVKNISSLAGFYRGVVSDGDYSTIFDIYAHDNTVAGIYSFGNHSEIAQNLALFNGIIGIYSFGNDSNITSNYAFFNYDGIVSQGNYARIFSNAAGGNTYFGICAGGAHDGPEPGDRGYGYYAYVADNVAIVNSIGIYNWLPHAVIEYNSVFQNEGVGIELSRHSNNTTVWRNYISDNPIGVALTDKAMNVSVIRNLIRADNNSGFYMNYQGGQGSGFIYDNFVASQVHINGTGQIDNFLWTNPSGPTPGLNLIGGPNIAGNFWTNQERSGWSDSQPPQKSGYSPEPYEILAGSGVYDTAPLVRPGNNVSAFSDDWTIIYPGGTTTHPKYSDIMYITQAKPGATLNTVTVDGSPVEPESHYVFYEIENDHTIETEGGPVPGQIHVRFEVSPTLGTYPSEVQFMDTSLGNPTSWFWQFGDGGNSTLQNPSHTYFVPGTYSVSLRAVNNQSGGSRVCNGCIEVRE